MHYTNIFPIKLREIIKILYDDNRFTRPTYEPGVPAPPKAFGTFLQLWVHQAGSLNRFISCLTHSINQAAPR